MALKSYIIYKFEEYDVVKDKLMNIQERCKNFDPLLFKSSSDKYWKREATKKIKEADCAIYFVSKESAKSENVDWELEKFIKYDKPIYTIRLDSFDKYNEVLYRKQAFGNFEYINKSRYMYSREVDNDILIKYINNNLELDISEDIIKNSNMSPEVLIEQYKAYLQTSEDVVSRRQAVSNFYITVNASILSILSTIVAVIGALNFDYSLLATIIGCYLVPLVGLVLCFNWRRVVTSYGQLNSAKMTVIAAMEKNLPFDIYDVEWKVQTDRLGKRKYVSFTRIEKLVPFLFSAIYGAIFLLAIVLSIIYFI